MPFLLECLEKHSICGKNMVPECLDWNQLILPWPLWRFWRCQNSSDSIDAVTVTPWTSVDQGMVLTGRLSLQFKVSSAALLSSAIDFLVISTLAALDPRPQRAGNSKDWFGPWSRDLVNFQIPALHGLGWLMMYMYLYIYISIVICIYNIYIYILYYIYYLYWYIIDFLYFYLYMHVYIYICVCVRSVSLSIIYLYLCIYIYIHMHMYVSLLVDSALHGRTMFKSTCCTTRLWTIWRTCVSVTILSSSTHRNVWLCGWQSTNDKLVFWVILGRCGILMTAPNHQWSATKITKIWMNLGWRKTAWSSPVWWCGARTLYEKWWPFML